MKKITQFFREHKFATIALTILVAVVLHLVGKETGHDANYQLDFAGAAAVCLTDAEKNGLTENEQKVVLAVKKLTVDLKAQVDSGKVSKEEVNAIIGGFKKEFDEGTLKELKAKMDEIEEAAKKQGISLASLSAKISGNDVGTKTIADQLKADEAELQTIHRNGVGVKQYLVTLNSKGEFVMKPHNEAKAAGPHASVADVGTSGNAASIAQSLDAATLLRMGGQAPIVSQFRNTPWLFNLCNLISQSFANPFAIWYEEDEKVGSSSNVAEGGAKPQVQYKYTLKSSTYNKEAMLVSFSDEFSLDFQRLQEDILGKTRVDLINRINSAVLSRVISNATAYTPSTAFGTVPDANEFDAIAAMAAQVENATFATMANAAVMSTFKKHKLGLLKNSQGSYLNPPASLSNIGFVGNPDMDGDNVLVGDFMNYNIILRGGMIIKVGYNGTDFANNMFSTVVEQYYYDYISNIRKKAIVKGPDFATVVAAITPA